MNTVKIKSRTINRISYGFPQVVKSSCADPFQTNTTTWRKMADNSTATTGDQFQVK